MDDKTVKGHVEDVAAKMAIRVAEAVERKVDRAVGEIRESHRTTLIVAVAVLGAMVIGAAVWG